MAKFFEAVISSLIMAALLAAGVWFGGPLVWKHLVDSENARNVVVAQQGALQTDTTSANKAQVSCAAEIKASMQAASAIAQASRPVVQKAGDPQPLITSDQIKAAIQ